MGLSDAQVKLIHDSWAPVKASLDTHGPAFYCHLFVSYPKHQDKFKSWKGKSAKLADLDAGQRQLATDVLTAVSHLVDNVADSAVLTKSLGDRAKDHKANMGITDADFQDVLNALLTYLQAAGVSGDTEAAWKIAVGAMMGIVSNS